MYSSFVWFRLQCFLFFSFINYPGTLPPSFTNPVYNAEMRDFEPTARENDYAEVTMLPRPAGDGLHPGYGDHALNDAYQEVPAFQGDGSGYLDVHPRPGISAEHVYDSFPDPADFDKARGVRPPSMFM